MHRTCLIFFVKSKMIFKFFIKIHSEKCCLSVCLSMLRIIRLRSIKYTEIVWNTFPTDRYLIDVSMISSLTYYFHAQCIWILELMKNVRILRISSGWNSNWTRAKCLYSWIKIFNASQVQITRGSNRVRISYRMFVIYMPNELLYITYYVSLNE